MTRPRIAITTGEPAGIGPEISAIAAGDALDADVVLIGDEALLAARAGAAGSPWPAHATVLHVPLAADSRPGRLDVRNAAYVLATLDRAIDGALAGRYDAIVTAPVQKSVINDAGVAFTGHTEYLAARAKAPQVVMMLAGDTAHGPLRVALATTHLPLAAVPAAITGETLVETIRILDRDLRIRYGLSHPRILVAGLNPHAGESGHLGREEIDVIAPVIRRLASEGLRIEGPFPADTLFTPRALQGADAVLAMFHDQGLPVLKHAAFGSAVNVTLGLPVVRTSVDHGTALDLAGAGEIDAGSLEAAITLAARLASRTAAR
jgi:4-hydroxythreonine-4-phosphate dehydrogenase